MSLFHFDIWFQMELDEPKRRDVLKLAGIGVAGSSASLSIMGEAEAIKQDLTLGKMDLLQIVLEHDISGGGAGIAEGPPVYLIDHSHKRAGLLSDYAVETLRNLNSAVTTGQHFHEPPIKLFNNKRSFIVTKSGFLATPEKLQYLAKPYREPSVFVSSVTNEGSVVQVEDKTIRVSPSDKQVSTELAEEQAYVYSDSKGKTVEKPEISEKRILPRLKLRHTSDVLMFGSRGKRVIPINPDDPRTRRFVSSYGEDDSSKVVQEDGADLLVVDNGGAN